MNYFLLTWNPGNWEWKELETASQQTGNGQPYNCQWSCGNRKNIAQGDRIFLLRQGEKPRGIMAVGRVISNGVLSRPHWDERKAGKGEANLQVEVSFDKVLNPETDTLLRVDHFPETHPLASVTWNTQVSGIQIPDEAAMMLERLWEEHLATTETTANSSTNRRNPSWQRDELILALDLYFRCSPVTIRVNDPMIIELSELLQRLPIHTNRGEREDFRSPSSVHMKLRNFLRFDSSNSWTGLTQGSRLEEEIWDEFAGKKEHLSGIASTIRSGVSLDDCPISDTLTEDEESFPEGKLIYRLHRKRERNTSLVKKAKQKAKARYGKLVCEVCEFNFASVYGSLGEDFIECHHTTPLSALEKERPTRLDEVALVCSNCHRMIHRKRPWLSVDQLKSILRVRAQEH